MLNNQLHQKDGNWFHHWQGLDTAITPDEADAIAKQRTFKLHTCNLTSDALDWAVAEAFGYTPRLQIGYIGGRLIAGGMVLSGYDAYYVVATYIPRVHIGEFKPQQYDVGGPILDQHRVSTEIAGDGWAALKNDCFGPATYAKSVKGTTRLVAGLRCLVDHFLGPTVEIPAELVDAELRRLAVRNQMANLQLA